MSDKIVRSKNWHFTMIENSVIDREDLDIYEKMTYIVLCRFAGTRESCFPSYATMAKSVGCSRMKVIKVVQQLIDKGLIIKEPRKDEKNSNTSNIYIIVDPDNTIQDPGVVNDVYQGGKPRIPGVVNDVYQGGKPRIPEEESFNKNQENKNQSIYRSENEDRLIDMDREKYREIIKQNIEYDFLTKQQKIDIEQIDEMIEIMLDTICSTKKYIKISGSNIPIEVVKNRFLKLNMEHIQYVLECFYKNTTEIRNIKAYILTALYNAPATIGHYYSAAVRHDLYSSDAIRQRRLEQERAEWEKEMSKPPADKKSIEKGLQMMRDILFGSQGSGFANTPAYS